MLGVTVPVLPGHGLATVAEVPAEVPAVPVAPGVEPLLEVALVPLVLPATVGEPEAAVVPQFTVLVVLPPGIVVVVL